jgi:sugar O-acyltransferase (sialic acid O-acetyltransferase NeuD family)
MSKPKLILIGAGGHTHACIDVIEQHGGYQIAGLVGMPDEMHTKHFGYEVIATDSDLLLLVKDYPNAMITVGQIKTPDHRIRLYRRASDLGFQLPTIIAPSAYVSSYASIGAGTIVMHNAIVNAGTKVGSNCIINTRALLDHGVTVEDHSHVSTGVIINGNVHIGSGSFVGSGSVIKEGVKLGRDCVVGMGLFVRHDQVERSRFLGKNIKVPYED